MSKSLSKKKPTLSETVKELERMLRESSEMNVRLKAEIEQKDLKIRALMKDLRRYVEKEETKLPVLQEKRQLESINEIFFTPQKRCKHWGEFK